VPALANEQLRAAREAERARQVERVLGEVFAPHAGGRLPRAPTTREYLDQAVVLVRRELGGQPASRASLLERLGVGYNLLGLYGPALDVLRESADVRRDLYGPDSVELAGVLIRMGQSQHYLGRYDAAEQSFRTALRIARLRFGPDDPSVTFAALDLADLLHTRGALTESERVLLDMRARLGREPDGDGAYAVATRDLANVLRDRGRLAESESLYREALRLLAARLGAGDPNVAATELYFARLLIRRGKLAEAERHLNSALAALRATFSGEHPLTGVGLRNLGYLRIVQGRYTDAADALAASETVLDQWLGPGHPMVWRTRAHQADLAWRRGRTAQAAALAERTVRAFEGLGLATHPSALDACLTLGDALLGLERPQEARQRLAPCAAAARREYIDGDARTLRIDDILRRARAAAPTSP